MTLSLDTLNTANKTRFVDGLADIFEHSPWVAARAYAKRPFASLKALHRAMVEVLAQADEQEQLALIRAHPDLAGKAALAGQVTEHSRQEQSGVGLDQLSQAEFDRFEQLNSAYKAQFDFPFILAVKGHTVHSILLSFEERLGNTLAEEKERALAEIAKIAQFRLEDLLGA